MAKYKYTYQKFDPKKMARIVGGNLSISTKTSGEVAAFIKGKQIDNAINYLKDVVDGKKAIPFKKRVKKIPHRKGMRTGRYPKNVSEHIIKLLNGLKSNAQDKGFDTSIMIIVHAAAQRAPIAFHYGRRRTERKNTHFEIIAEEVEKLKEKKKAQSKRKHLATPTGAGKPKKKPAEAPKTQPKTKETKKEIPKKKPAKKTPTAAELAEKKKTKETKE
ncbi:50S ribosomal protein L22 [Candidatus Woesearchaeota archaeon]|nr:50S ribosomal protein L22 [Candidatus Woesearchaeota archaeon]